MEFKEIRAAIASLNTTALNFYQNAQLILQSIKQAKQNGCTLRTGGQLQLSGFGCQDNFLQHQTTDLCWQVFSQMLMQIPQDIICMIGIPAYHRGCLYNCILIVLNKKILGLRPKILVCDQVNYYQSRIFTGWSIDKAVEDFVLPQSIIKLTGQAKTKIGIIMIETLQTMIGFQICQQLWQQQTIGTLYRQQGAQIIVNFSASHAQQNKNSNRIDLLKSLNSKLGSIYLYGNLVGTDSGRLYFDGISFVLANDRLISINKPFQLHPCQLIYAQIYLQDVRVNRSFFKYQIKKIADIHIINIDFSLYKIQNLPFNQYYKVQRGFQNSITFQPSHYIFDYMCKVGATGFMLPLSGGMDSASSALTVYNLARLIYNQIQTPYIHKLAIKKGWVGKSVKQICGSLLHTVYLSTKHTSQQSRKRAKNLAEQIGSNHRQFDIDEIYQKTMDDLHKSIGRQIKFMAQGGSYKDDVAKQNVQARIRMVMTYLLSQTVSEKDFLLVLGSSYFTKYDCSSADLNPISTFSKQQISNYLKWNYKEGIKSAQQIFQAIPSAQLRPGFSQNDQEQIGLTYKQMQLFGKLKKVMHLGPVYAFQHIVKYKLMDLEQAAKKVKLFYRAFSINRHKAAVLTPGVFLHQAGSDDQRSDQRPLISNQSYQFKKIDQILEKHKMKMQNVK